MTNVKILCQLKSTTQMLAGCSLLFVLFLSFLFLLNFIHPSWFNSYVFHKPCHLSSISLSHWCPLVILVSTPYFGLWWLYRSEFSLSNQTWSILKVESYIYLISRHPYSAWRHTPLASCAEYGLHSCQIQWQKCWFGGPSVYFTQKLVVKVNVSVRKILVVPEYLMCY